MASRRAPSSPACSPPTLTSSRPRDPVRRIASFGANGTPRAVLFYATDDNRAPAAIERLVSVAGFDPVKAGGVEAALRIEVFGDLHQFGGLNGKVIDVNEARTAVAAGA
jgi:hypothetical protein